MSSAKRSKASSIITTVAIILFVLAFIAAAYNLYKYYRNRRRSSRSSASSLLEAGGPRADALGPASPVHTGFDTGITGAKTHSRNRSDHFKRDLKDKPLPIDPENPQRRLADKVEKEYGWRWSWTGKQEQRRPAALAKENDPNFETIGLAH